MLKIQEQHEIEMNHINSLNYCQWSYMWKRVILVQTHTHTHSESCAFTLQSAVRQIQVRCTSIEMNRNTAQIADGQWNSEALSQCSAS